jgi:uncharacterized protein YxjI
MEHILGRNAFLVREHVGLFKAANNFDVFDPATGEAIIHCREDNLGMLTKLLRFTDYKRMTPFEVELRTPAGEPLVTVRRGVSVFISTVQVFDASGELLGSFREKLLSIGGAFRVFDSVGNEVCYLKGKWTGWDFRFLAGERELARVTKKWAGIGKELFTSADNYVVTISDDVPPASPLRKLILAAVMSIDLVLKE